jgi:hypothetical protein
LIAFTTGFPSAPFAARQDQADERHDQVGHDRRDDLPDGGADDHAHRQGQGVLLQQEIPERASHSYLRGR